MSGDVNLRTEYLPPDQTRRGYKNGAILVCLHNASDAVLAVRSLAFSSLTRVVDTADLVNVRLVRRVANFHEFSPLTDLELEPNGVWEFAITGLSHRPSHCLDGPKSGYLITQDGVRSDVKCKGLLPPIGTSPGYLKPNYNGEMTVPIHLVPWPNLVAIEKVCGLVRLVLGSGCNAKDRVGFQRIEQLVARVFPDETAGNDAVIVNFCHEIRPEFSYQIHFDHSRIEIVFGDEAGRDFGLICLFQMATAARLDSERFKFPIQGEISDKPRHDWRGVHLDVVRHFQPVERILALLDIMAWHKMNVLHLHLTDDEGWRIEIDGLPELTQIGGFRGPDEPLIGQGGYLNQRYGGVYSPADIEKIVAHAACYHIDIVPEIDIPGHCCAVLKALPHLCDGAEKPRSYRSIQGYFNNALNPGVPETYEVIETILASVTAQFPGEYVHLGGDEVGQNAWLDSPAARRLMAEENLADTAELQAYFMEKTQAILTGMGRKMAAWDEVGDGGGVTGTLMVAWQKSDVIARLIREGYEVVAAPGDAYYLDMVQGSDWAEPGLSWAGIVPVKTTYEYEATDGLTPQEVAKLRGVQACIWTENLIDLNLFNHMVFPRLAAVAEAGWTNAENKDWLRFAAQINLLPILRD